ncbi:unnamed protein product [Blumeria hordei]|uniref:DUF4484 domain-containing protein n=2 Tax=Blumeria hordei TaxID=2867405 RepID=A0A383UWF0_BLUHO|nr:DUF2347 superfamily [Blumeria hordei DH14]SZF03895.1 unnamed protein product [Blumeria hordei]
MATVQPGQRSMAIEIPMGLESTVLPRISALFLIYFDIKAGYTIAWKRSLSNVQLEGVVEYKSLPSGLHLVKEDLIYFVHDNYAGLSAFINIPAGEEMRNSRMIAVGIMVPLICGRLGRSWKHSENLKEMARFELIHDTSKTKVLEDYWEQHKELNLSIHFDHESLLDTPSNPEFKSLPSSPSKPRIQKRNLSTSDAPSCVPSQDTLPDNHPASSISSLLETFGPLIFPVYRAALLRQRILITTTVPIQEVCKYVYDISILSNVPLAVRHLLAPQAPPQRLRSLFSIGIHDIPFLEEDLRMSKLDHINTESRYSEIRGVLGSGWIACTTDKVLATKNTLYDVLITMPSKHQDDSDMLWPKLQTSQGVEIKASQRDLNRYKSLRWGLTRQISPPATPNLKDPPSTNTEEAAGRSSLKDNTLSVPARNSSLGLQNTDSIIEPITWSALAYSSFVWWASASEQYLWLREGCEADSLLLSNLSTSNQTFSNPQLSPTPKSPGKSMSLHGKSARVETAIIAYFNSLTTRTICLLNDLSETTELDDEQYDESNPLRPTSGSCDDNFGPVIDVNCADIARLGLDVWSTADHDFIAELTQKYLGRTASIIGPFIEVCGIKVC